MLDITAQRRELRLTAGVTDGSDLRLGLPPGRWEIARRAPDGTAAGAAVLATLNGNRFHVPGVKLREALRITRL